MEIRRISRKINFTTGPKSISKAFAKGSAAKGVRIKPKI